MNRNALRFGLAACGALLFASGGCAKILGLEPAELYDPGTTSTGSSSSSSSGTVICNPGTTISCYTGPAGTQGVGICKAGTAVCSDDGTGYGPCTGSVLPQPEDCSTPDDEDCNGKSEQCPLWAKNFGDENNQIVSGLAIDSQDNIVIVGGFVGTVTFGTEQFANGGVFIAKFDTFGNHLWSKKLSDGAQSVNAVAVDNSNNILVTGGCTGMANFGGSPLSCSGSSDVFVAKYDPSGSHIWSYRFGDASMQEGMAIAAYTSGGVLIAGNFQGSVSFGGSTHTSPGGQDVFVAKLNTDGQYQWSMAATGDSKDRMLLDATLDPMGNALLIGWFKGTMGFGGTLTSAGGRDVFVVKLSSINGAHLWSKSYGDMLDFQEGAAIASDPSSNVLIAGTYYGALDFGGGGLTAMAQDIFLAKLNPALDPNTHLWSKRFGDDNFQIASSVACDMSNGDVVLSGYFDGAIDLGGGSLMTSGNKDIVVARFDPDGNHLWSRRFGDGAVQYGGVVKVDSLGNVVVAGNYEGVVDFGYGALPSAGGTDIYLAKLPK